MIVSWDFRICGLVSCDRFSITKGKDLQISKAGGPFDNITK